MRNEYANNNNTKKEQIERDITKILNACAEERKYELLRRNMSRIYAFVPFKKLHDVTVAQYSSLQGTNLRV